MEGPGLGRARLPAHDARGARNPRRLLARRQADRLFRDLRGADGDLRHAVGRRTAPAPHLARRAGARRGLDAPGRSALFHERLAGHARTPARRRGSPVGRDPPHPPRAGGGRRVRERRIPRVHALRPRQRQRAHLPRRGDGLALALGRARRSGGRAPHARERRRQSQPPRVGRSPRVPVGPLRPHEPLDERRERAGRPGPHAPRRLRGAGAFDLERARGLSPRRRPAPARSRERQRSRGADPPRFRFRPAAGTLAEEAPGPVLPRGRLEDGRAARDHREGPRRHRRRGRAAPRGHRAARGYAGAVGCLHARRQAGAAHRGHGRGIRAVAPSRGRQRPRTRPHEGRRHAALGGLALARRAVDRPCGHARPALAHEGRHRRDAPRRAGPGRR